MAKPKPRPEPVDETGPTLLAQAIESDDDATKLVYADWLEERGDPAAQAIRLSCADDAKRLDKLEKLIEQHRAAWIDPIASWIRPTDGEPVLRRGMYARVYGGAGAYAQKANQAALLAASRRFGVRGTMLRGKAAKVATCETLAWTRELWWWDCQLDDAGLAALAASPHLARLRRLTLEKVRCSGDGIRALGALARLEHLGLPAPVYFGTWGAGDVLDVIARLPRLTSVDLTGLNKVDPGVLGNDPRAEQLTALHLHVGRLAELSGATRLVNLRELRVESLRTEPADVEALLANPTFGKLERLAFYTYTTKLPAPLIERIASRYQTRWTRPT